MYLPNTKSCRTNAISQSGRPRWPTDAFGPEHQAESTHFTCTRVIRELSRDKWAVTSTPSSIRTILGYRSISAKATSTCAVTQSHHQIECIDSKGATHVHLKLTADENIRKS